MTWVSAVDISLHPTLPKVLAFCKFWHLFAPHLTFVEAGKAEKQKRKEAGKAEKHEKQRSRKSKKAGKAEKQRSRKAEKQKSRSRKAER